MPPQLPQSQGRQSILPLFPLLSSHQLPTRLDASIQLLSTLPLAQPLPADSDTPYALKRLLTGLASSNESARQGFAVALAQLVALLPDDKAQHVLPQLFDQTTSKAGMDAREERDLLFARLMGLHALVRSGVLVRPGAASREGTAWQEVVGALVGLGNKKTWIREPSYWVVCEALKALLTSDAGFKDECVKWAVQRLVNDAREKAKGWGPEKVAIVLVLQSHGVKADWSSVLAPQFASGSLLARTSLSALATALKGNAVTSSGPEASGSSGPKQGVNATKTSKGAAAPAPGQAPHFVWSLLRDVYFPSEGVAKPAAAAAKFSDFWRICVDNALFGSPSLPLKSLGFSLITLFLPTLPANELIAVLGGSNTLRTFANHLRGSSAQGGAERTLSRVADKLATSALPSYLSTAPSAALPLLKALTGPPNASHNAFETKFLERVVARLPLTGVKGWIEYLQSMILSPAAHQGEEEELDAQDEMELEANADKEKRLTAQRTWALDQLLHVGKNGGVQKDEEAMKGMLEFLAVVGWFEVTKEASKGAASYVPTPAFTPTQRLAARSRFFSVLTALVSAVPVSTPTASSTVASPSSTIAGGPAWLARALSLLDNLAADEKHFKRASTDGDDDDEDSEDKDLEDRVKALHTALAASSSAPAPAAAADKKSKKGKKADAAAAGAASPKEEERKSFVRALCEGVRLVAWDEGAEDAAEVLESTIDAISALFPSVAAALPAKATEESDTDEDDDEDDAPEPTTILVDLLLALLRRSSAFVKSVAGVVLKGFADEVGEQAVELLVEQWRVEEAEVEDAEDVEMEDVEGEKKQKKGKKVENDAEDSGSDSDDDSDDDSEGGFEVDEAFKAELLAALEAGGMGVPNSISKEDGEEESDDEDEVSPVAKGDDESEEEEVLDDDAMLELDERLADIFRANGGGRRSKKRDRTDSLHYRIRCLDLVDVLAHASPSSPFLIPTLVPLFNLVRTATPVEAELQTKASKLLRFLVQPRKAASAPTVPSSSADAALEALEELHRVAASVESGDLAPLSAQVALALVRSAIASAPTTAPAAVSRIAASSFEAYITTKNAKTKCQPLLMSELAKRAPAAVWETREKVLELASGEKVNAFRRVQAYEVVQTLVTSYAGLKTNESKSSLLAFLPAYSASLFSTVSTSLLSTPSASGALDAPRLKLLAKNALSAARLSVQLSSQSDAAAVWKPTQWAALLDPSQGKVSDRFKGATGVLGLVKQLVGVLGSSVEGEPKAAKKDKKRKAVDAPSASSATPAAATAAVSTPNGKQKKAKTGSTPAAKPEEEVQDESTGDVSMSAVEAGEGTPSGKKGKKDKKKRRESGASVKA